MRSASPEPHGPSRPHPAIFVPSRRRHPDDWLDRRCDEVISPAVRTALWDFVRETVPVTHPGATAPAGRPRLSGLNDGRGAAVKIAMLSADGGAGACLVLRAGPGVPEPGPGPHRPWRQELGAPGVRAGATAVTGIEQVTAADVAALLGGAPSAGAAAEPAASPVRPWLVVRVAVPEATGTLSVDPGDGLLRPVLDFTVLALDGPRPPGERPARCPLCGCGRIRRYATFDLCPDCGWIARGPGATRRHHPASDPALP
ncbi:hypothetical protein [Couchioplanes caeruleus]|uniref:Uncharacterized protein n=2 Tax=Couchioplanes caeruleus TaxID=56438 RepID=A0A1K0FGC7_9ACTN|nr:hypothetical protein [Couchioplanes caeruleus]OJF11768.1 hypothetical protein BG844_24400 [Couchioplanes caeruleus subsp. caeruleus]ROP34106.1 hypothetical protein EDD30_7177 [Couchioplanes caeruleus]